MAARKVVSHKTVLGACVDGHFTLLFCLITMEKDVVYILTVRENVIIRYVEFIANITPVFPVFCGHFSTFLVISLV